MLCCDEKSQCQALERTQPGLPLGIGDIRTRTHDYKRHGTVTLFAALNYLEGKLIARTESKHTHVEWLRFLKQIDREMPKDLTIHVIADNYATHKHAKMKAWLKKHRRFQIHFTPTSSSWMNLVERFFADLTADCIREGSFQSVRELVGAIEEYLYARNENPKRYIPAPDKVSGWYRVLSSFAIGSYDVTQDGNAAVFSARSTDGKSQIWRARLDRSSSPKLIDSGGSGDAPFFCAGGQILFRVSDGKTNYLYRINQDGSGREKVAPYPINNVMSVSPDGRWAATYVPVNDVLANSPQMAIPIQGGDAVRICSGFCVAQWVPDGRYLYVAVEHGSGLIPGRQ